MTLLVAPDVSARRFIVLVSLLQGLLLYLAQTGIEHEWWPFSELGGRVCWYTLVLTVPTLMTLSVVTLRDARFWQQTVVAALSFVALAAWAAWSASGDHDLRAASVLGPFGATVALGWFVLLPWLQIRLAHGRFAALYEELFEHAWQNGLVLVLTAIFTGLCWGVLWLCAALFKLIDIDFFERLFGESEFAYLATGVMVGLGILVGRVQPSAVRVARQILLAVFKGLLPLLAAVALMFLVSLPFTGLEALWKTRYATGTLAWLLVLLVLFANAVFQDGNIERPYPVVLRRAVEAALLAMPVFAAIALYALALRIAQYGWSQDRYWAALAVLVLAAYSVGYAYSVLRSRERWLDGVRRVNVIVALAVIGLVAASNSPLLDPHRLAVASQLARVTDASFDPRHLRFDSGRRGIQALRALRDDARVQADAALAKRIEATLTETLSPWEQPRAAPSADDLAARILVPEGVTPPPPGFFAAYAESQKDSYSRCEGDIDCVLLDPDLDADGRRELVVCRVIADVSLQCEAFAEREGRWTAIGSLTPSDGTGGHAAVGALREGRFDTETPAWRTLRIGNARYTVAERP